MAAANLNILIEQGSTYSRLLTFKDSNGSAINLTGYSFSGQVRSRYDSNSVIASFTFTLANQTTNTGEVTVSIPSSTTALIPVDASSSVAHTTTAYTYDMELTDTTGAVSRFLQGVANVSPEVTR